MRSSRGHDRALTNDLVTALQECRRDMSGSEARDRYLMSLVVKAFSDEQLRMVANSNIIEDEQFTELEKTLAELVPAQVARFIDRVEVNPSVLAGDAYDLARSLAEAAVRLPQDELREPRRGE